MAKRKGGRAPRPGSPNPGGTPTPSGGPGGQSTFVFQQTGTFAFQQAGSFAFGPAAGSPPMPGGTTPVPQPAPAGGATALRAAGRLVGTVGRAGLAAGTAAAGGNVVGAAAGVATAFTAITSAVGPVGVALGSLGVAAVAAVGAVELLTGILLRRAQELEKYSPQLAEAGSRAELRQLGTDIREAQQLGPALAKLEDAQSELSQTVTELLTPIKEALAEFLTEALDIIRAILEIMKGPIAVAVEVIKAIGEMIASLPGVKQILGALHEIAQNTRKPIDPAIDALWDGWNELSRKAQNITGNGGLDELRDQLRDVKLNLPVFNGF